MKAAEAEAKELRKENESLIYSAEDKLKIPENSFIQLEVEKKQMDIDVIKKEMDSLMKRYMEHRKDLGRATQEILLASRQIEEKTKEAESQKKKYETEKQKVQFKRKVRLCPHFQ